MSLIMHTRYSDSGINTISDVEIFKAKINIKNEKRKIVHIRLDYNHESSAWQTMECSIPFIHSINYPFIVIISGEDLTFPNQIDSRWQSPPHLKLIKTLYTSIIEHPQLIHCFIENRDEIHPKTSSLPLGINPREMPQSNPDVILNYMKLIPRIEGRETKVICIHRDRPGDRMIINTLKNTYWKNICITSGRFSQDSWWKLLQKFPFIICAHGGGIDPCPKIWEALCVGCIPIIKHSALDDIYSMFPVIFVDSWEEDTITLDKLRTWQERLQPAYDDPAIRSEWQKKLFLSYWADKISTVV